MFVIVLEGKKDSGKTETINIVYQLLLYSGYIQLKNAPNGFRFRSHENKCKTNDFADILVKNSKIIGVFSMGDEDVYDKDDGDTYTIGNTLKAFFDAGCTTTVCVCSTEPKKHYDEAMLSIRQYPCYILTKTKIIDEAIHRIENGKCAKEIFDLI